MVQRFLLKLIKAKEINKLKMKLSKIFDVLNCTSQQNALGK